MAISRMQQPRQMYNQGMMVHDPRQAYGLGGFIKKAVRGVKKIAKSPLGKDGFNRWSWCLSVRWIICPWWVKE